jgi:hypothetical protein
MQSPSRLEEPCHKHSEAFFSTTPFERVCSLSVFFLLAGSRDDAKHNTKRTLTIPFACMARAADSLRLFAAWSPAPISSPPVRAG